MARRSAKNKGRLGVRRPVRSWVKRRRVIVPYGVEINTHGVRK